jgi:5-methylcytosine-specific restriction endonuclease McrA
LKTKCKQCYREYSIKQYKESPRTRLQQYESGIRRRYGLTWDTHTELILRAKGHCDSCGEPFSGVDKEINIDHCHTTGDVRGLLCKGCNTSAGNLGDCPDKIFSLIKYIMDTRYNPFLKSEHLHSGKKITQG